MVKCFAFFATAHDGVPNMVSFGVDPRLMTQSGCVLVPFSPAVREAIMDIEVFALLHKSDCDVILHSVASPRAGKVLWSDESSVD